MFALTETVEITKACDSRVKNSWIPTGTAESALDRDSVEAQFSSLSDPASAFTPTGALSDLIHC